MSSDNDERLFEEEKTIYVRYDLLRKVERDLCQNACTKVEREASHYLPPAQPQPVHPVCSIVILLSPAYHDHHDVDCYDHNDHFDNHLLRFDLSSHSFSNTCSSTSLPPPSSSSPPLSPPWFQETLADRPSYGKTTNLEPFFAALRNVSSFSVLSWAVSNPMS